MDPTTTRPAPPGRPRRRISPWMLALIGLLSAPVFVFVIASDEASHELHYGQFKKKLAQKEIVSARIGPSSITGELTTKGEDGRPVRFHTSRLGMENDSELYPMLKDNIPDSAYEAESAPSAVQSILLPTALMVGVMFALVFFLRRSGGLGSAMAFAKSKPKVYDKGERQYTFDDVAGNDEAVAELREVVDFLRTPEKFQAVGGRIPKGVLLVGPPGTGKTLLAKAVAGEAGVPFFSLSGSDFCEMYVGVGAARVRSLFNQADAKAPCLIFIDELDAIGRARSPGGAGSDSERDQTLNQLLVQMDGFDSNRGIILIAATNRPETLDPALVRPGRFDRQVVVDRPDIIGREQILKVHVKQVTLDDEINLRQIAAITSGFVGADLANLVNEAALLAARKGKTKVGEIEFQEGVERVIAGPEKRQRVIRPDERERIAYHEAGHALVARSLPQTDAVHKVTILGRGSAALGYTMYRPEDDQFLHTKTWLRSKLCTLLGGTIAEEVVYGEVSDGATSDLQRATQIARKMVAEFGMSPKIGRVSYVSEGRSPFLAGGGANDYAWSQQTAHEIDQEVRRLLDETQALAERILTERRDALEAITQALLQRESIDSAELQAIIDEHPHEPHVA